MAVVQRMPGQFDTKPTAVEKISLNKFEKESQIFKKTSFSFFDEHENFHALATKVGTNSFFITGASGVFGQWITCFLDWVVARDLGSPTTAMLLRERDLKSNRNVNIISGDIQNFTFPKDEYDYLIHLAAPTAKDTFNGMAENKKLKQLDL